MEELGAAPASLEEEAAPIGRSTAAGPVPKTGGTSVTHESVNYTSAAERCETCEYFDENAFMCKKHKFDAEPQGHCDSFEVMGGEGGSELPEGEGEEDMADLEEEPEQLEEEEAY